MARDDIGHLRRSVSLVETAQRFGIELTKDGREFKACCPFHAEQTPSFTIFRGNDGMGRFYCFGCGERGDLVDFVIKLKGVEYREAINILGGGASGANIAPKRIQVTSIYDGFLPIAPPREIEPKKRIALYNPKRAGEANEWGSFTPSAVYPYRRADGSLIGYVLRRELKDGGKETPMVMWVKTPNGNEGWSRFPFPKLRPLYGLQDLEDGKQVCVVEGEKCRDAYASVFRKQVVTWPGGTQGVKHADWSPLAGRSVLIWPDADDPGQRTAQEIAGILHTLDARIKIASFQFRN